MISELLQDIWDVLMMNKVFIDPALFFADHCDHFVQVEKERILLNIDGVEYELTIKPV